MSLTIQGSSASAMTSRSALTCVTWFFKIMWSLSMLFIAYTFYTTYFLTIGTRERDKSGLIGDGLGQEKTSQVKAISWHDFLSSARPTAVPYTAVPAGCISHIIRLDELQRVGRTMQVEGSPVPRTAVTICCHTHFGEVVPRASPTHPTPSSPARCDWVKVWASCAQLGRGQQSPTVELIITLILSRSQRRTL